MDKKSIFKGVLGFLTLAILVLYPQFFGILLIVGAALSALIVFSMVFANISRRFYNYYRAYVLKKSTDFWLEDCYLVTNGIFQEKQRYFDMVYSLDKQETKRIANTFYDKLASKGINQAEEVDFNGFGFGRMDKILLRELGKELPPKMDEMGQSSTEENIREFLEQISEKSKTDLLEKVEIREIDEREAGNNEEHTNYSLRLNGNEVIQFKDYLPYEHQMGALNTKLLDSLGSDTRLYYFYQDVAGAISQDEADKIQEALNIRPKEID
jgi:hypothetical protein